MKCFFLLQIMGSTMLGHVQSVLLRSISPACVLQRSSEKQRILAQWLLPTSPVSYVLSQRMYSSTMHKVLTFPKVFTTKDLRFRSPSSLICHSEKALGSRNFSLTSCAKTNKEDPYILKGKLVYKGNLAGSIKGVKLFSFSTSLMGLAMQPAIYMQNEGLPTGFKLALAGAVNFFVFLNPILIHFITKRYIRDIYWDPETGIFTATTYTFFLRTKELVFLADDVHVPAVPGIFTSLKVKGEPVFFDPGSFLSQEAYVHLMGFNKPLDWELPKKEDCEDQGKKLS